MNTFFFFFKSSGWALQDRQIICFLLSKCITNENPLLVQQFTLPVIYFLFIPKFMIFFLIFIYLFILLFRATPMAYGVSQARGPRGATTVGLRHSHSNTGSKPHLRPTSQLMTSPDP